MTELYKAKLALQELMAYLEDEGDEQIQRLLKGCRPLIKSLKVGKRVIKRGPGKVSWRKQLELLLKSYNRKIINISGIGLDYKTIYVLAAGQTEVKSYTDKDYKALFMRFDKLLSK